MPSSTPENKYDLGLGRTASEQFEDLQVPSGAWCQIRKPNPKELMRLGYLSEFDSLSSLVDRKHIKRVKGAPPEVDTKSLMKDPDAIIRVLDLADEICSHVIVQPTVRNAMRPVKDAKGKEQINPRTGKPLMEAIPPNEREEGVVYTDQLDDFDKMFIFQYSVGGSPDLERFRQQISESD